MKLSFSNITLGGGPNYFLNSPEDQVPQLNNIGIQVPRTDFFRNVSGFFGQAIKPFSGTLIGDSQSDYRIRRRNLINLIKQEFTFTLTDNFINSDGIEQTQASYEFTGKIVDVDFRNEQSNFGEYSIQIACEDSRLYLLPEEIVETNIALQGFVFPLVFPFVFEGAEVTEITINNQGPLELYPEIKLYGPGENYDIINITDPDNPTTFSYTGELLTTDVVTITPNPTDPIKARKNGVGVVSSTNSNWEALILQPGINKFQIQVGSGIDPFVTKVRFRYNLAFISY